MGILYSIAEALDIIKTTYPAIVKDSKEVFIVNAANTTIWNSYDWQEYLTKLPPFFLAPELQHYGTPYYAVPADYHALRSAYIWDLDNNSKTSDLKILRDRDESYYDAWPDSISYEPKLRAFRLFPRPPSNIGNTRYVVYGTYKIKPTVITRATINSTKIPLSDEYFSTYVAALEYWAAKTTGNPNAGQAMLTPGGIQYNGLLGNLMAMLDIMANDQGLSRGDSTLVPDDPFYNDYGYGYF